MTRLAGLLTIWWSIPTAIVGAVVLHQRWYGQYGVPFASVEFVIILASCLFVLGLFGWRLMAPAFRQFHDDQK